MGYKIRLPASSVEEVAGNSQLDRRTKLLDLCQRLLSSDRAACIWPFHYVTELLRREFEQKGAAFDWRAAQVRSTEYEREIVCREIIGDSLASEHLKVVRESDQEFKDLFNETRPDFDEFFSGGNPRPATFGEFLAQLQQKRGAYWSFGVGFYQRVGSNTADETIIRQFVDICSPFRALLIASVLAQYERCVRDLRKGTSYRAGRIDLFMSVYLPYCDVFVTNDRQQEICLLEIASAGGLATDILSYDRLRCGLLVP